MSDSYSLKPLSGQYMITDTAQTINGAKTFTSPATFNSTLAVNSIIPASGTITQLGPSQEHIFDPTQYTNTVATASTSTSTGALVVTGGVGVGGDVNAANVYAPNLSPFYIPWQMYTQLGPSSGGAQYTTTNDVAYFNYIGYLTRSKVVNYIKFYQGAPGVGSQTAEVAIYSGPAPDFGISPTFTWVGGSNSLQDLTNAANNNTWLSNSSPLALTLTPGVHYYAAFRNVMGTTPHKGLKTPDIQSPYHFFKTSAGVLASGTKSSCTSLTPSGSCIVLAVD